MVNLLRDNLTRIKAALANGQGVEVKESKELINQILAQQDKRKQEVSLKLKVFQKEQKEMTQRLLELLTKGRNLRIKDLKLMLKEFDVQHKERQARQEERKIEVQKRRGEVRGMLVEFKKKRKEAVKSWRNDSLKVISPVRPPHQ
jgi:tyrosine-protein phosphatase YwqE